MSVIRNNDGIDHVVQLSNLTITFVVLALDSAKEYRIYYETIDGK